MRRVFAALAGKVRRMTSGLREKSDVQIDDYELEHFLLYNGLVGSTPDNQPQYKDVRNDIVQAINDGSGHQLAIAFKSLAPLLWEDRLQKIFGEIAAINREGAIKCLLAERPVDDSTGDTACLSHTNWKVSSNAARMLAFLDVKEAIPRLIDLLPSCVETKRAAFCHVAYSVAKLGSEQARQALIKELKNEEPWFCVDAAGALSHYSLSAVSADLMEAMLSGNVLDDYMAVAIARRHSVTDFSEFKNDDIQEGAAEMVLAMLKALNGPFHSESILTPQLENVQERIMELAYVKPTSRRIAAAIALNNYLGEQAGGYPPIKDLSNSDHYNAVKQTLSNAKFETAAQLGQFKHALALTTQFKLTEMSPLLVPLVKRDFAALPELMSCLAALGDVSAAPLIAKIIEERIDLGKRSSLMLSAHPVVEDDKESADIYWTALKALGSLPDKTSLDVLTRAVKDHAPDKREQALLSLQTILLVSELRTNYSGNFEQLLRERSDDPAVSVQTAALTGIAQHKMTSLIPEVLKALHSRELAIHRRAAETLVSLANSGHEQAVKQSIEASLSKEHDSGKRTRLNKVMQQIPGVS